MTRRPASAPRPGLRERKKAKTRAAIREHALRLVREQGYAATTVEQIAAAAEISPSTFFRYFATKEDAVLYDPYDPLVAEALRGQPADLSPLQAFRSATRDAFTALPDAELARLREFLVMVHDVPELRVRMLDELTRSAQLTAELLAERTGRRPDDLAVQIFAGAVLGAMTVVITSAVADPNADIPTLIDTVLEQLQNGLPL
jgi:AcrR family transcriptional regulator